MVHLGEERGAVALEAFDDMHLPQRTVGVELAAHDTRDEGIQLGAPAGRRQAGPAQVVVDLEVGVVDPHRMVQAERNAHRPLAQRGDEVDPLLDDPSDLRIARRG